MDELKQTRKNDQNRDIKPVRKRDDGFFNRWKTKEGTRWMIAGD